MYQIGEKDEVVELKGFPQSSVGAPLPFIVSDEGRIFLAYLVQDEPDWEIAKTEDADGESFAIVEFDGYLSFMFGMPNDEAIHGHPLYERGLHAYGIFEIQNSSWIKKLDQMNSVHDRHDPENFALLKHFIFTFHDSTFECVSKGFDVSSLNGSYELVWRELQTRLFSKLYW